ncbi:DUF2971 domain-containing protein [Shinella oryzae]|uniref:DUF2971 domain-containing protein n=1 Tax=Shinella oryzae TaxID=2871820 RepID=UPI001FF23B5E|nr:DUF2971 domain-containing protein [Shinella oryzae]UPA25356.1 DUF2971 domain-containing protein [Shinella oryzae]
MATDSGDLFASFFPDFKKIPGAKDVPELLSHYTSLEGFLSIVKYHSIWASNILFLNDKEEMQYGIDVARDVVAEIEKTTSRADRPRVIRQREIPDVYASCFCEHHDLLSQWRGYGNSNQTVSIQFRGRDLFRLARIYNFDLERVIYGRKHTMELLRERLAIAEDDPSLIQAIMNDNSIGPDEMRYARIINLAPRFKNEAFEEEKEWRIIAKQQVVKEVQYRVRDNVVMPYVVISNVGAGLPIQGVTVGPGKETSLTVRSIEKFLSNSPFYRDVRVSPSKVPFRS